jgi:hypothetical protein
MTTDNPKIRGMTSASSILAACLLLSSCITPRPPTGASSPSGIKWDGNTQDAGIDAGTGAGKPLPCSESYHRQYLAWLPQFGAGCNAPANPFTPVDIAGQQPYLVTAEGAEDYEAMNRASKATKLTPPPAKPSPTPTPAKL